MTQHDPINSPSHYAEGRAYEPIDVIHDWELGYNLGNVVKYVSRAGRKLNLVEDLKKARFYLNKEIELLEAVPFAVTYEDILADAAHAATEGDELLAEYGLTHADDNAVTVYLDVDDQLLPGWDADDDYMWDPSLGPVDLTSEELNEILSKKDLDQFGPNEIVSTVHRRGLIIGFKKDGTSCLLGRDGRCE